MDLELSTDQNLLSDVATRFVGAKYGSEARRAILKSPPGWSREVWAELVELGLVSLLVPLELGGYGGGPVEAMLAMNAFGCAMLLEPYWSSAILATSLLVRLGGERANTLATELATGAKIATVAHVEPGHRYDTTVLKTTARKAGDGWSLTGGKALVVGAAAADVLLVTARTEPGGALVVLAVPRATDGVRIREYRTLDGRAAADVTLENARVPGDALLGSDGAAGASDTSTARALEDAHDVAVAALCADAVGAMKALIDATRAYLATRKQFGQPIGRFQALQHRMADMLIHFEQAKSMAYLAAMQCETADLAERRRVMSAAKVVIGQSGRYIGQQAVQLHGGMGMADELDVGHYFKRLTATELTLGDTDHHLSLYAATLKPE